MNNNKNISLYIPHVFDTISETRILNVFESFGTIANLDFVSKVGKDGHNYKSVYIHFNKWNNDDKTRLFRKELSDNQKVNVTYDKPWFWIVLEYKKKQIMSTPPNTPEQILNKRKPNKPRTNLKPPKLVLDELVRNLNKETMSQMNEVEKLIPQESFELVDVGYVRHLEQQLTVLYGMLANM
jgi:hypothetical protein